MSTTTQILFNSPALHSLKREQLVKLCKIHSLKANGKNVDIIQRLRQHAQTLPKESPLSIAARSEEVDSIQSTDTNEQIEGDTEEESTAEDEQDLSHNQRVRPSEQWEMVMDSIEEVEENSSQGTMSSQRTITGGTGEFGTGASKVSTVGSSIRAFASSLGLKKTMSKPSTASSQTSATANSQPEMVINTAHNSIPYSALPPSASVPQADQFTRDSGRPSLGSKESPLPGHILRPGIPAPPNARLSLGLGLGVPSTPTRQGQPTTTIRLVLNPLAAKDDNPASYAAGQNGTPQLKPFQTNFDVTFGTPAPGNPFNFGFGRVGSWPPVGEEAANSGLYPKLTLADLAPSFSPLPATKMDDDVQMPGSLTPLSHSNLRAPTSPTPFIFGSPNHRVSNHQFRDAAASVLEEMNARLRAEGVDEISVDVVNKLHPDKKVTLSAPREIKRLPTTKRGEISSKFHAAHEREFSKMEGINDTFKRKQQRYAEFSPDKKDVDDDNVETKEPIVGKKRKSSVLAPDERPRGPSVVGSKSRASATRVISIGRRLKGIPGGFEVDDEDDRADSSRPGKRVRADSEAPTCEELTRLEEEEHRQMESETEEKEAIRKKLDANRARRRSSAASGRKSIGRAGGRKSNKPRPSVLIKPKPKPSRFGFLASAKSLVQSVWGRGKTPATVPPRTISKPTHIPTTGIIEAVPMTKEDKNRTKLAAPVVVPKIKSALAPARPTTRNISGARPSAVKQRSQRAAADSATPRSRSPLPTFEEAPTVTSNRSAGPGLNSLQSNTNRVSFAHGTGKSWTSGGPVSSMGTKLGGVGGSSNGANSMGSRQVLSTGSRTSSTRSVGPSSTSSKEPTRLSSRVLAPTASSLAKTTHRRSNSGSSVVLSSSSFVDAKFTVQPSQDQEAPLEKPTLGLITNNLALHNETRSVTPSSYSGETSKALTLPRSRIPPPVKKGSTNTAVEENLSSNASQATIQVKRTASGRKPRISRSKIISRLASQRAASGSSTASSNSSSSVLKPRMPGSATRSRKVRSSLGVQVARASYGGGGTGIKGRASSSNTPLALAMSAKRRARQSQYSRRTSSKVVNMRPLDQPGMAVDG